MAVKGKTKDDILAAFERRLANDAERRRGPRLPRSTGSPRCGSRTSCLERATLARHPRPHPHLSRRSAPARARARIGSSRTAPSCVADGRIEAVGEARDDSRARAAGRDGRRSRWLPHHARLHRRAYPLSADAGHRLLWRAAARLAAQLHLRRGAEIRRPGALRDASPRSFSTSCSAAGTTTAMVYCTVHPAIGRRLLRRGRTARRAHDRRQGDDGPRRARGADATRPQRGYDESKALIERWRGPRPARLRDHAALRDDLDAGAARGGRRAARANFRMLMSRRISTRTRPRSRWSPSAVSGGAELSRRLRRAPGCSGRARCSAIASICADDRSRRARARPARSPPSARRRTCFSAPACSIRRGSLGGRADRARHRRRRRHQLFDAAHRRRGLQGAAAQRPVLAGAARLLPDDARQRAGAQPRRPDRLDRTGQGGRPRRARPARDARRWRTGWSRPAATSRSNSSR